MVSILGISLTWPDNFHFDSLECFDHHINKPSLVYRIMRDLTKENQMISNKQQIPTIKHGKEAISRLF